MYKVIFGLLLSFDNFSGGWGVKSGSGQETASLKIITSFKKCVESWSRCEHTI